MPKKGLKYLLVSLVLLIWGLIAFRIVQGMGHDDTLVVPVQQREVPKTEAVQDTFSLLADYPDPFEGQPDSALEDPVEKSSSGSIHPGMPANQPGIPSPPVFNPADLKYTGFIGTVNTKHKTAIITYRGIEYSVKEKDKVEQLQILKIDPAFMIVSFGGSRQVINIER